MSEVTTFAERYEKQHPACPFGISGACCKNCNMGPCRISKKTSEGVCGATVDLIAARNIARQVAAGSSAHSDHAREIAHLLKMVGEDKAKGFSIKDAEKLKKIAVEFGIDIKGKNDKQIAFLLGEKALSEFGQQEGELVLTKRAPKKQRQIWRNLNIMPRGIDREIVELMHRTNMGVDSDYKSLMYGAMKTALSNGWGGSMIATELSDILFGSPTPVRAKVDLGVIKEEQVNILVHGHDPIIAEALVDASNDKDMLALAESKGAEGINIAGICCTANEILMRHGIPVAGSFLQQEVAILSGLVEAMLVDVQCVMPALPKLAQNFHTEIITTSSKAQINGATYIEFEEADSIKSAKEVITKAIENFTKRDKTKIQKSEKETDLIAGFTTENVFYHLGGRFRASYRPLNDNIINGRIRGVAAVVGCDNPKMGSGKNHITLVKELIKNDVLVVQTGCSAISCAKEGLLQPEAAFKFAGKGLQQVCAAVGIPPVLHNGACVDNSRILIECCEMVKEGGIGDSLDQLPAAGAAPEWMSEKAIAIGWYCVASGVYVVFGSPMAISGSENIVNYITKEIESVTGGKWAFESDPIKIAHMMIDHINLKRNALKLAPVLFDEYATV